MTEQENMLLYGSEKQLGIYQITARDPEHDYRFMGLDYVEKKGITVTRADYDLIYAAPLTEKDTLDGIYPMTAVFNISGYYNANMFQVLIGVVILMVCVILSLLILKGLNRKTK